MYGMCMCACDARASIPTYMRGWGSAAVVRGGMDQPIGLVCGHWLATRAQQNHLLAVRQ